MPRRPRRQGVVYGPPALRAQREQGTIVGRLIGAIVVVGSLVALMVGSLAVLGSGAGKGPLTTPTATAAALASPSSSPRATIAATSPPPTPSPTLLPPPSPSATPFAVQLVEGPGKITFASNYDGNFNLINPHVDFKLSDNFAWQANIDQPVGRVKVDFLVYRVDTATMAETLVHHTDFVGKNAGAKFYYAKAAVDHEVDGPGTFVMRYSVNGTTISEGYFTVSE
jgi:hypothetical protein